MGRKSEINKKDLLNLYEISDEEFARITDNLYSQKIDYKSLPNLVLLPNVKEELRNELNIKGNLYITKNRLLHTNPNQKNARKNQGFTKDEYKAIPDTIRKATYALKETDSEYNSFLITALDKNDSTKANCIIFDEDKNGNLLTTIKKVPILSLRNRTYEIVGTGVEPAISNALREPSTTLTTSPNNQNLITKEDFVKTQAYADIEERNVALEIRHVLKEGEIHNLPIVTQKEFNRIVDSLYHEPKPDYKNIPNVIRLPGINPELAKKLDVKNANFFLKTNIAHVRPSRKGSYNQDLRIEEMKGMLDFIKNANIAYIDNDERHKNFMIVGSDSQDSKKANKIVFNQDELGNYIVTIGKIQSVEFEKKQYDKVAVGVEPTIWQEFDTPALATMLRPSTTLSNKVTISQTAEKSNDIIQGQSSAEEERNVALEEKSMFKESREILFSEQVDLVLAEKYNRFNALKVCDTPQVFLDAGLKQLPILYTQNHLKDVIHEKSKENPHWHGLSVENVKQIPEQLKNPAFLLDSLSEINSDSIIAVLGSVDNDNAPIFAVIKPNGHGTYNFEKIDSNFMMSVYGKDNGFSEYIERAIKENKVLYWNKEKSQALFSVLQLQLPQGLNNLDSNKILHQTNSVVNTNYQIISGRRTEKLDHSKERNVALEETNQKEYSSDSITASIKSALVEKAEPLETIDFTLENYNSLFPRGIVQTPIETVKLGENQFEKLDANNRNRFLLATYQTLATPDIVIDENRNGYHSHNYIKSFIFDEKTKAVQDIVVSIDGENVSITAHPRDINNIVNKIKTPDQLVYAAAEVGRMIEQRTQYAQSIVNPTRVDRLSTISVPLNKEYSRETALSTIKEISEKTIFSNERNVALEEKSMFKESREILFSEQVDLVLAGKYNRFNALKVCDTPDLLLQSGLKQLPMMYTPRHLREAIQQKDLHNHTHGIKIEQIKSLPELIKNPVMIYDSLSRSDSLLVLTSEIDEDKMPIVIAIRPNGKGTYELKKIDSNFITSVYGRENFEQHINAVINNGKLIYWNKEKSQELFSVLGQQLPKGLNNLDSNKILHQTNSVVNTNYQIISGRRAEELDHSKERNVALEETNIQGDKIMPEKENELYVSEEQALRIQLAREIKQNMPNLSDGERAAAIAILEAGASSQKMSITDYVQKTFPNGVFGDYDRAQNAAHQQGFEINGAVSVSGFGANARAVIYASKTADFSTWCHELSHIWQAQLTGTLKDDAEKAFQVQDGNWQESIYTFADGHTDTSAEAFAYGFEDFLKHKAGEMATEDKKVIFEKFADYMSRTYNGIKQNIEVSEEIAKVYENFVQLDDNILAEAEKAVRMEKEQEQKINEIFNSPNLKTSQKVSATIGVVSDEFAALSSQYGYDIKGYSHTIDNFFVSHVMKQHGDKEAEERRGNIAITHSDIRNVFSVYSHPDYIIFGTKTKTGNPAIVYVKNIGNSTIFVEDVRSGKKELAAQTLYKKFGTIDVSSKKEAPELYAHSDPESVYIVDVKEKFVNEIENGELIFQSAYHGNGAVSVSGFGANARVVIYASKTADFSTWCHELSHIWQAQLTGTLKDDAEKAFQVQDGNWQESIYTFADGHTDTSAEAFAYGFEDFLKHKAGEMATEDKKVIFEKFADYMSRTYNGIKQNIEVSEEIAKVYENFVQLDDNILAEAEKAVRMEKEFASAVILAESKPIEITHNHLQDITDLKELRTTAREEYKKLGSAITKDGRNVQFSTVGFKELKNHSAKRELLDVIPQLKYLTENAEYLFSESPEHFTKSDTLYFHNYGVKIKINDNEQLLRISVRETKNHDYFYDAQNTKVELIQKGLSSSNIDRSTNPADADKSLTKDKLYQWLKFVKENDVDNRISFQAAYHGSGASFDRFNTAQYGLSGEGSMSFGWGTYLGQTEFEQRNVALEETDIQGDKIMPAKENELYVSEEQALRIQLAREIKQNMPNLSDGERAAAIAILEAGASSQKMSITDYVQKTFPNGVFGDYDRAQNAAHQQGFEINGAVSVSGFGANARAVIYASKTADFSTWCHELSHIWQAQLTGTLKDDAEKAFQVQDGNWQESIYTFADGHTDTSAEAFAYGFEDFLKHKAGEMATEDKKVIFEKFADYMSRTYNGIKQNIEVSEEIAKVYENFVQLDDNILAEAEKAVRMEIEATGTFDKINSIFFEPNTGDTEERSDSILNGEPVYSVNTADFVINDGEKYKIAARRYIQEHPQGTAHTNIGDIDINQSSLDHSFEHSTYEDKIHVIPALKTVLESGTYLGVMKDADGKRINNHYFAAPVKIDEETKIVFIRVRETAGDKSRFYIHDVFTSDEIEKVNSYSGIPVTLRTKTGADLYKSIIQDYEKNNIIQNNPILFQAAYHGSGAVSVSGFGANARAVIYASKTADFSTWCHELSHIWQAQLTGTLKDDAEKAFQVQDGNWQESIYTFADGHTDTSAEAFAYGFEDFLKHKAGEMATEDKKVIFEKFADYMSRTYNGIKQNIEVSEEIAKVYENFVQLDDNILAEAEKAVRMEKEFASAVILAESKPIEITHNHLQDITDLKELRTTAREEYKKLGSAITKDGRNVQFTTAGFKELKNHSAKRVLLDVIPQLKKLTENAEYLFSEKPEHFTKQDTKNFHNYGVKINYHGESSLLRISVRESDKGDFYYDMQNTEIVEIKKGLETSHFRGTNTASKSQDLTKDKLYQWLKFVKENDVDDRISFQSAYHGSGASFDRFNTAQYGFSGEGSMSFGWGTYLTSSEDIARDYAIRRTSFTNKIEELQQKYPDSNPHIIPIHNNMSVGMSFEDAKKAYIDYLKENHIKGIRQVIKNINKFTEEDFTSPGQKRNLYSVEIPDGKYLQWNKNLSNNEKESLSQSLKANNIHIGLNGINGRNLYLSISGALGSDKAASEFLKESGYTGISYPAGTINGNGNDATNYVIFNDDDITIKEHLQFQLVGERSIMRMTQNEERKRILEDLAAAKLMDEKYSNIEPSLKATRIRFATGWEKSADGQWKYELDDSLNRIKSGSLFEKILNTSPEMLEQLTKNTTLTLDDIMEAPELYGVFPFMKNVRVGFYSDPNAFRAVLTPDGIKINTKYLDGISGEKGMKGVLAHEIQHIIQAVEYSGSKGINGESIEQLYNNMMEAMKAASIKRYDYDVSSLEHGLSEYMHDSGEIEARNVARRIFMNASERRHTTLESTEDIARNMQFQIIGEQGAGELDRNTESNERIANLDTAKEMEKAEKDTNAIRLATGWEKGADGKLVVNRISSVYRKDSDFFFLNQLRKGNLEYIDEKRSQEWAVRQRLQLPPLTDILGYNQNITTKEDFVNSQKSLSKKRNVQARMRFTPEQRINTLLSDTADIASKDQIVCLTDLQVKAEILKTQTRSAALR